MKTKEIFSSTDLCMTATMLYYGSELVDCKRNDSGQITFSVDYKENPDTLKDFLVKYLTNTIPVSPMRYMAFHKFLKRRITETLAK